MRRLLLVLFFCISGLAAIADGNVVVDGVSYRTVDSYNGNYAYVKGPYGTDYSYDIVIQEVVVNNGVNYPVTWIAPDAFKGNKKITSIVIPSSITHLTDEQFLGCTGLVAVYITDLSAWCRIDFGTKVFSNPLACAHNLYLNGVLVKDLVIPNDITSIGKNQFYGCSSLLSVSIPPTVTEIESGAFSGCSGLKALYIYDLIAWCRLKFKTYEDNPLSLAHTLYLNDVLFTDFVFPSDSLRRIGEYQFYGCTSLQTVTIPISDDHTNGPLDFRIRESAFANCTNLSSVDLSRQVTTIGKEAFKNCKKLKTVNNLFVLDVIYEGTFSGCERLTSITIPWVNRIESHAFYGCKGLTAISIPSSVKTIGSNAFRGCSGIVSADIPCSSIGDFAFQNCTSLASVTFSNANVASGGYSIGSYAFSGCSSLGSVTIPKSFNAIGSAAFYNSGLTSITLECGELQSVNDDGLGSLPRLTTINYNMNSIPSIAGKLFKNCPNLTRINIGADVEEINENAFSFSNCGPVHLVVALGAIPAVLNGNVFNGFDSETSILMVPCNSKLSYFSNWNLFSFDHIIEDCNNYTITIEISYNIGGQVNVSLQQAQMGETVTVIVTPNEGYVLTSIKVYNANDPSQVVPISQSGQKQDISYSFVMMPFPVKVEASFAKTSIGVIEESNVNASVFPNPADDLIFIKADDLQHVVVFNLLGQTLLDTRASGDIVECHLGRFGSGIYLVRMETTRGVITRRVLVK